MTENICSVPVISPLRAWLESLRLRTLPLACASVITGSSLAWWQGHFTLSVAVLALLTTALLQILSNLANDYGDATKGSDTPERIGPLRGMQKGAISQKQMGFALIIAVALTIVSGVALVIHSCRSLNDMLGFLAMGALAILAAIAYTVGRKPYGYLGLGDASVLIFFGWLGVLGSYYLQTHRIEMALLWPASGCGLLAVAVLNANNMRDIECDRQNGKLTLAVRLGATVARYYHVLLLTGSMLCFAQFAIVNSLNMAGWLFLLAAPWLFRQGRYVLQQPTALAMCPVLATTVKMALLVNVLFAIGLAIN
ncbi:1,4-dihydroxy-2-naphthoate polyprenyltransferase [Erwinia tracheiphila]|uniref:1,4-dihydroxy-2-naphthoate polyprenyltransferase n=1 Tax=Erwinia tracheiphila TaxID=65700 RepID=UPI000341397B|nr:1,4-dihydroxy-2-naphthoate polyprenyltransferase [Erwinia tracheiphila]EOS94668.1 1,4-dihydroxy-2-naphthoate octaprenyltransferase [Erwinia tracheiphila PSU-1]UIA88278.1 1,4-dihydroxy-2-naphthoate polyprenyltransferase [Erwinia tracheiphila]UIA96301.1 1,4-dihydroxy-2-naphthoate polyprenyltransferase [Erwinia tracheiphila]